MFSISLLLLSSSWYESVVNRGCDSRSKDVLRLPPAGFGFVRLLKNIMSFDEQSMLPWLLGWTFSDCPENIDICFEGVNLLCELYLWKIALLKSSLAMMVTLLYSMYTLGRKRTQSEKLTAKQEMELATITQVAGSMEAMKLMSSNNAPLTMRLYVEYSIIEDSPTMLSRSE
jgi:hypothetical protein